MTRRSAATVPLGLAAACLAVAFLQRPGEAYTDTRIELSLDPSGFLSRVAQVWSPTGDLGHVHSSLFAGYLFPTGPYYALADAAGLSAWVAQRLWLGLVLAAAAWGAVRVVDDLWSRERGPAHVVAGLVYALNPFTIVTIATRGTGPLLTLAVLPWVLVAVHRALADPRRWRWPIVAGLALAAAGGAVNAAGIVWILLAAAALAVYEAGVLGLGWRPLGSVAWRAGLCMLGASLWWIVPLALQATAGVDFQRFAEQPGTIWATTSVPESMRLLGFWVLYLGAGFGNARLQLSVAHDLLFSPGAVVASFVLPLVAFAGLRWTRSWRYAPFFGLLALLALLIMVAGFPPGTPLRRALLFVSDHARSLQLVRTTYKAAPLLALSLACLAGVAVARVRRPALAAAALLVAAALGSLPFVTGDAIDRRAAYGHVPAAWPEAMDAASRAASGGRRVMILPGSMFAHYRWGSTTESIGPVLAGDPVLVRQTIRYADPRAAQLQDAVDDLVQQGRLVPGQLPSLLRLMGVGEVVEQTDDDPGQSGSLPPGGLPAALATEPELSRPAAAFGPARRFPPLRGRSGAGATLPELTLFHLRPAGAPAVRVQGDAGGEVVDGDAEGLVELAAQRSLDPALPLDYAGDIDRTELARRVRSGAALVFTDSGRRRVLSASRMRANHGPALGPSDPISPESATFDLFPDARDRTVALYTGLRYLRSPRADIVQLPEHRPYAALDGRLDTQWIASAFEPEDQYMELALRRPRAVAAIRVWPNADRLGRTSRLAVSVNGGGESVHALHPGWNRIALGARRLESLRLRPTRVTGSKENRKGNGGIAEIQVPGLRVHERLRLPTRLATQARGLDLSHSPLEVLLRRTTADFPYRAGAEAATPQAARELDMVDAEPGLERELRLPAARTFELGGWASAAPAGADAALDRLAGMPRTWRFSSSGPFEGVPGRRASSAFDGDTRTAWAGELLPGRPPWLALHSPRPLDVRRLRLVRGERSYRFPSRVRVSSGSGAGQAADVSAGGLVRLAVPVRGRDLRIQVLAARPARLRAAALAEVRVPGLAPPRPRRRGAFDAGCGALAVRAGAASAGARVSGRLEDLDAGRPLRLRGCGPVRLAAGRSLLSAPPGPAFRPDHLRLLSPAPAPLTRPETPGAVLDPGHGSGSSWDGARLRVNGPAELVLAQSYSSHWRAWCRDRAGKEHDLGAPRPAAGFANGWPVKPGCVGARFAFAPQTAAKVSYLLSAIAVAIMLIVLALWGRRKSRAPAGSADWSAPDAGPRLGWGPALALAAGVGLVGGFVFALRAGAVLALAALVLGRIGLRPRRLFALAGALIAVVPLIYVAFPSSSAPRRTFGYAIEHLGAHWVAVGALCCVAAGCLVDAAALRRAARALRP